MMFRSLAFGACWFFAAAMPLPSVAQINIVVMSESFGITVDPVGSIANHIRAGDYPLVVTPIGHLSVGAEPA